MQLSIVIICWNDLKVIGDCLRSIFETTKAVQFEVIVSDNGSTDGSIEFIRKTFPIVRLLENGENLGFAKGNNAGIRQCVGQYVLILNPDTIIHEQALDRWVAFADQHPEAGGFGCRVLNPDGSFQNSARPFPTPWRGWIAALCLRPLAYLSDLFISDIYTGWDGETERLIDWQSGCCVLFRNSILKSLGGFDEQFFYHYEEVDLCRRVWGSGSQIIYAPHITITHLGGQSVSRFPVRFELERNRNRYRFFYKHYGQGGARECRRILLAKLHIRHIGYGLKNCFASNEALNQRLSMYRLCISWNNRIDPVRFIEHGEEPTLNVPPPG